MQIEGLTPYVDQNVRNKNIKLVIEAADKRIEEYEGLYAEREIIRTRIRLHEDSIRALKEAIAEEFRRWQWATFNGDAVEAANAKGMAAEYKRALMDQEGGLPAAYDSLEKAEFDETEEAHRLYLDLDYVRVELAQHRATLPQHIGLELDRARQKWREKETSVSVADLPRDASYPPTKELKESRYKITAEGEEPSTADRLDVYAKLRR